MNYEQAAKELACALLFRVCWTESEYWTDNGEVSLIRIPEIHETEDLQIAMKVLGLPNPCPEKQFSDAIGAY